MRTTSGVETLSLRGLARYNAAGFRGAPKVNPTFIIEYAGFAVLGLSVCGSIYACAATWATWRFLRRPARTPAVWPSISVLKPLHGDEPELYENLASFCAQDYAGPIQTILGVRDPADPALDVAERLRNDHPERDIVLVRDPTTHGTNRKIGNLINMAAHVVGDVVVISDSDVRMPPDGLRRIVAALEEPGVGLIYCLYRGRPTASVWSKLAAMDVNTRLAPSVVVGEALGAHPCLGPTMALRADVLRAIGGFEHLADFLADDFELGRAVRAAGYRIACPPMVIDHVFPERGAREMLVHELRWARTIRLVEPAGHLGSVIMHFVPLALLGAALTGFAGWSLALLGGLVLLRQAQALILSRLLSFDARWLWLLAPRDLLSFGVFLASIFGDRVEWRGNLLRVGRDGAIATT
jgi:ceramide glucosyltransferase